MNHEMNKYYFKLAFFLPVIFGIKSIDRFFQVREFFKTHGKSLRNPCRCLFETSHCFISRFCKNWQPLNLNKLIFIGCFIDYNNLVWYWSSLSFRIAWSIMNSIPAAPCSCPGALNHVVAKNIYFKIFV